MSKNYDLPFSTPDPDTRSVAILQPSQIRLQFTRANCAILRAISISTAPLITKKSLYKKRGR